MSIMKFKSQINTTHFLNIHAPIPFMKRYLLVIKYSSQTIRTIDSQDRQLVSSSRV